MKGPMWKCCNLVVAARKGRLRMLRFLLIAFLVSNSSLVSSAKICDDRNLSGQCYRVDSSGNFYAFGSYSHLSRDVISAQLMVGQSNLILNRARYRVKPQGQLIREAVVWAVYGDELTAGISPRSGIKKIKLPTGNISACRYENTSCFAFSNSEKDIYYGDMVRRNGREVRNGTGLLLTNSGDLYIGKFDNGQPNGRGHLIFFNGEEYVGNFERGGFSGYGTFYFSSGKSYQGQWKDNLMHGEGTVYDTGGAPEWVGTWSSGRKVTPSEVVATRSSLTPEPIVRVEARPSQAVTDGVIRLQRLLISTGFLVGASDGVPGSATKTAMQKIISELPAAHHQPLSATNWAEAGDLELAEATLRRYVAEPLGRCPNNMHPKSFCFYGSD
jgi:hypothetical protein